MSSLPKTYRVCRYDAANKILDADWIKADSDEQVIAQLQASGFGTKCEIWDGRRLVTQLESDRRFA